MNDKTMLALAYDPDADRFALEEQAVPVPGRLDVLVRVLACGLNPVDAKISRWKQMAPGMNPHWVGGLDVAGEIVALGVDVRDWQIGDRVLYHGDMLRPHGGFAEYALHDSRTLTPHPAVSPVIAAATPCAGWTAWRALVDKLRVSSRDSLFITGASGAVGSFAVQIARHLGLSQIIACCSAANIDYVSSLGASHVIDYRSDDVVATIRAITGGEGVSRALNGVGRAMDCQVAAALGFEGEMLELVDVVRPESYPGAFMQGLSFHQLSLGSAHRNGLRGFATLCAAATAMNQLVGTGQIQVGRLNEIELKQVGEALMGMRAQQTSGKFVLRMA